MQRVASDSARRRAPATPYLQDEARAPVSERRPGRRCHHPRDLPPPAGPKAIPRARFPFLKIIVSARVCHAISRPSALAAIRPAAEYLRESAARSHPSTFARLVIPARIKLRPRHTPPPAPAAADAPGHYELAPPRVQTPRALPPVAPVS